MKERRNEGKKERRNEGMKERRMEGAKAIERAAFKMASIVLRFKVTFDLTYNCC